MSQLFYDEVTGSTTLLTDDGRLVPADRPGVIAQAGRQFADLGSGLQTAAGHLMDRPDWIAEAQADTAERNRIFEGADEAYPIESMIGQALPGMATAPITAGGVIGSLALNAGLGGVESALDVGEQGTALERFGYGAGAGVVGDMVGRILGRAFNTSVAMGDALGGKVLKANPEAEAWEALGGQTMAYQRMEPGTLGQSFAERVTQGAQSSIWGAPGVKQTHMDTEALMNVSAANAVGTPLHTNGVLDRTWRKTALDRFQMGFAEVASIAQRQGDLQLAGPLRSTLNNMQSIEKLKKFGLFAGLDKKGRGSAYMTGKEWKIARQALADEAAQEPNSEVAGRLYSLIDELDSNMERKLGTAGPDFTEAFGKLREQYRVFMQLEKPGVINKNGNISIPRLGSALDNRSTGFGRTATAGNREVFPETQQLLDLVEAGDKTQFQAFKSSGTAENLALRNTMSDVHSAVAEGGPTGFMGLMASQAAPLMSPALEAGGGLPYDALINRSAGKVWERAGGGYGRSLLDETFYPFVGHDDERQP